MDLSKTASPPATIDRNAFDSRFGNRDDLACELGRRRNQALADRRTFFDQDRGKRHLKARAAPALLVGKFTCTWRPP